MKYLFVISMGLLLTSCITSKKAYDYVVTDTFRDNDERAKLAQAFEDEFPDYRDTPTVITKTDSTAYNEFIHNENALLDEVIKAYGIIDSLNALPRYEGDTTAKKHKCVFSPGDSARAVKNYLAQRKPPPVKEQTEKDTPIKNDGRLAGLEKALADCRNENSRLAATAKEATEKLKGKNKTVTWLWVIISLIAAGAVFKFLNSKKLI